MSRYRAANARPSGLRPLRAPSRVGGSHPDDERYFDTSGDEAEARMQADAEQDRLDDYTPAGEQPWNQRPAAVVRLPAPAPVERKVA